MMVFMGCDSEIMVFTFRSLHITDGLPINWLILDGLQLELVEILDTKFNVSPFCVADEEVPLDG